VKREDINFILQKADKNSLRDVYKSIKSKYSVKILQSPTAQTLLQPVHDPISGGEFYAGEVLVTTTIVTVGDSQNRGWAMVQDDQEQLSLYVSVCDGAFGAGYFTDEIETLVQQTQIEIQKEQNKINQKINSTKVNFDLMSEV